MLRPTRKLLARIGVVGIIGAAFASAAIAADTTGALESNVGAVSAAATNVVSSASLPAAASEVAVMVLDALAGGSNPSTVASQRSDPESRDQAVTGNALSAAQRLVPGGTVGMRPGWGCGDDNHTHTGPPGRPATAARPPGCTKKK
jgi:hypothetical protein